MIVVFLPILLLVKLLPKTELISLMIVHYQVSVRVCIHPFTYYHVKGTTGPKLPYVIVGDEGFPQRQNLLRPYPGRYLNQEKSVFNYRLS